MRTGRFYPPGNIPDTHFFSRLSQPQGHSAAGRIMSMNHTHVLSSYSSGTPTLVTFEDAMPRVLVSPFSYHYGNAWIGTSLLTRPVRVRATQTIGCTEREREREREREGERESVCVCVLRSFVTSEHEVCF